MINTIKSIEIELSSLCNAACPQCMREFRYDDKSWFPQTYLKTSAFNSISLQIWNNIEKIDFAGTFGDPATAPNLIEVCKLINSKNKNIDISISTNGGLKTVDFWKELASVLLDNDTVVFSIDGLSDTLDIYRVNVNYNKVLTNAKAFIAAGGNAVWQFVAFKHNQHQIDEAEKLAKDLGFSSFKIVPTQREKIDELAGVCRISKGVAILPPTIPTLKNNNESSFPITLEKLLKETNTTEISCRAKKEQSIYIDCTGNVVPCCFIGASLYTRPAIFKINDGWDEIYQPYVNSANLYVSPLEDILKSDFFNKIEESWSKEYSTGRIASCGMTCSATSASVHDHKIREGIYRQLQ